MLKCVLLKLLSDTAIDFRIELCNIWGCKLVVWLELRAMTFLHVAIVINLDIRVLFLKLWIPLSIWFGWDISHLKHVLVLNLADCIDKEVGGAVLNVLNENLVLLIEVVAHEYIWSYNLLSCTLWFISLTLGLVISILRKYFTLPSKVGSFFTAIQGHVGEKLHIKCLNNVITQA